MTTAKTQNAIFRFGGQGVEEAALAAFAESLDTHIYNVRLAGARIGVDPVRLAEHDDSKWEAEEFPHYARQFFGAEKDPMGWARAWLHHQNFNDHHPEYWYLRSGGGNPDSGVISNLFPMPTDAILEMVADWMGASKTYTGSWSIRGWWDKKQQGMALHPQTRLEVVQILKAFDYGDSFDE